MFEVFEHTADLGLRIEAADLGGLFEDAGRALFSVIVANLPDVRSCTTVDYQVPGTQLDYLLVDWLNELLFTFESRRLLLCDFHIRMDHQGLTGVAEGELLDSERHQMDHEVKAITYHNLRVAQTTAGWEAEVIVDI